MVTDGSLGVNTLWVFDQSMAYNCNILDKGAKFPKIELCCIVDVVKYSCHTKEFLKLRFVTLSFCPFLWKRANTEKRASELFTVANLHYQPIWSKPNYFLTSQNCRIALILFLPKYYALNNYIVQECYLPCIWL